MNTEQIISQIQADKDSGVVKPYWSYIFSNAEDLSDGAGGANIEAYQAVDSAYRTIHPELSDADIAEQANTPEYQVARDQAQARGQAQGRASGPSAEQAYDMQESANRAINAGGVNPYSASEMAQSLYNQLVSEKNQAGSSLINTGSWTAEKEAQLQDAMEQKNYYTNTNVASGKGGDTGYTGAGAVAGQQAMGAAMDAANNGAQRMGAAADAAALGAQAGYGEGQQSAQDARLVSELISSLAPPDQQVKAMTEASPAMQGKEGEAAEAAGLSNESLTPKTQSIGSSLLDLGKAIPVVSDIIGGVEAGKNAWNAGSNLVSKLSDALSDPTSPTPTPSAPSMPSAGVGAFGSPYGTVSAPPTVGTPPKPSTPTGGLPAVTPSPLKAGSSTFAKNLEGKLRKPSTPNVGFGINIEKNPMAKATKTPKLF